MTISTAVKLYLYLVLLLLLLVLLLQQHLFVAQGIVLQVLA
jgi:hypothetical protein